jgi:DNA mismatch repair protein MutL
VGDSPFARGDEGGRAPAFGEARPTINEAPPPRFFSQLRYIGPLARRFWLCEGQGGTLAIIDPHAAFERARFEALRSGLGRDTGRSLFSESVQLPAPEAKIIAQRLGALARLGLEVEPFGGAAFAVRGAPAALQGTDLRAVLTELSAALPGDDAEEPAQFTAALRLLACHAARAAPFEPTEDQRAALFASLDDAEHRQACRHGRIVVAELPLLELERRARGLDPA